VRYLALGILDGLIAAGTLSASLILQGRGMDARLLSPLIIIVASINSLTSFVAEFAHQMRSISELTYRLSFRRARDWTLLHSRAFYRAARSALENFAASAAGAAAVLLPACLLPSLSIMAIAALTAALSAIFARGSGVGLLAFMSAMSAAVAAGILIGLAFPIVVPA
jgi:VIT1/CCC1 family predicted Fe2+/Mn2+ transporter